MASAARAGAALAALLGLLPGAAAAGEVAVPPSAVVAEATKANEIAQVSEQWSGKTVNDLFREYNNIFKYGNRNAASHKWVHFLLERSEQMTHERLIYMFSGFCAVSGSPIRPSDYNRYKLTLDRVDGSGKARGFMHYCCWPCVCDTQDFIKVDTRTVKTIDGERKYNFAVIGNPCDHADKLKAPFEDAFGRGTTTLHETAPEVRCQDGVITDAPMSDNGYVIIGMFFDPPAGSENDRALTATREARGQPNPGRVSAVGDVQFQDEHEFSDMCEDRARQGYNSGMGEIFRKVAGISAIKVGSASADTASLRALAAPEAAEEAQAMPCPDPADPDSACASDL